jgi:hypothetical protein
MLRGLVLFIPWCFRSSFKLFSYQKPSVSSEQVDRDANRSLISLSSFTDPIITRGGGRLYITKLANARAWRMETGRLAIARDLISALVRFGDALFLEDFTRPN